MKPSVLVSELGGTVLQTFPLLRGCESFILDCAIVTMVDFFEMRQILADVRLRGTLGVPYGFLIMPLFGFLLWQVVIRIEFFRDRVDGIVSLTHMLILLQLTVLQPSVVSADSIYPIMQYIKVLFKSNRRGFAIFSDASLLHGGIV